MHTPSQDESEKREESRSCFARRWKQLLVVAVLAGIIVWAVIDAVTKNCTFEEPEEDRVQRLFCEGVINVTSDGAAVPGDPFICGTLENGTMSEDGLGWDGSIPSQCTRPASCLSVGFDSVLEWIAENPGLGWLVTATVYAILTVALIPGSVLTIGSGVAFGTALGLWKGVLVGASAVYVGANLGANMAFLLGRFLLKEHIEHWSSRFPLIKALDKALEEKGFQVVLLLRLSPVVPFNVFNFIMGSTSVSLRNYAWGTALGICPGTFGFVLIGALVGAAAFESSAGSSSDGLQCEDSEDGKVIRLVLLIVGSVATFVAVVLISVYARRQFQRLKEELRVQDSGEQRSRAATSPEP